MRPMERAASRHPAPALLAVLAALALPGCLFTRSQPGVMLATTPPGATVLVDGRDSGFVTPATLSLERSAWHRIDFQLDGFATESRLVGPGKRPELIPWTQGYVGVYTWYFPLFLPMEYLFFPLRIDDNLVPQRIHVRLEHVGEEP